MNISLNESTYLIWTYGKMSLMDLFTTLVHKVSNGSHRSPQRSFYVINQFGTVYYKFVQQL